MGLTSRALRLTEAFLPVVLSHGNVQAREMTLLLLAKCKLARGKSIKQAISILSLAQDCLKKARDHIEMQIKWTQPAKTLSSTPERTEIRFPNLKRGNYDKVTSKHVNFFQSLLGTDRVLLDSTDIESFNTDFAKHVKGSSEVVLKPKTTEEVSALVRYCYTNNLALCPQGGNSGLVAGSVPAFDEVIISTALMNQILHVDEFSGALTCQSGCILEVLDNYLEEYGLMMPLDLGAKGICHIGGNLSTNAGGIRLFRYGNLHGSVLGLEVVLANGEVVDLMSTVKKDNTGYHLKNLFIGAEGTLGIITKVVIQCPPLPKSITVGLLGLNSFQSVLEAFKHARTNLGEILSACEMMDATGFETTTRTFNMKNPLSDKYQFYMLLETRSGLGENDVDKMNNFVANLIGTGVVTDGFVTDEPTKMKQIWEIREKMALAAFKAGYAYKYDVSLPHKNFYKLVEIMRERLKGTSATIVMGYGHLGDGNLHLNICSNEFDQSLKDQIEPFVFETTQKLNGSISAEHGIGLQKPQFLHFSKTQTSIDLMKDIKGLLDPKGILNPYKVLPQ
ncbi:hypothetical protein RUM44_000224 [Polyplax serrata]|uniref:D-2-hydroxyglutarate dehydrogenase, mitochondrial n=1 Tax=Polyplax serrata TaxID=468196 RepID=A0ABR1B4U6_POLSC